MNISDVTALTAIGAVITALTGVIKILWVKIESAIQKSEEARIACENDRKSLWIELRQLAEKTGLCNADPCPLKQKK
ncbi:hypothetical protein UFOVP296_30 [uncultured Caudovirales phage]|uniref:Uncharacterized protein n=1 Tax=uncultured Caudovirales phage TaxID=2100421 RepID=A0A6J5S027_9CAUD|nr:hypothetical protein UFOVP296_30 [uncultured Caudovirales phage]CAB4169808.1 hypothetical protein UFOVP912_5 [uncultured Caudovirales phage]CAB4199398.1 hypothetical protein UFOVP1334_37 [uncultured Caudovirales phage]